MAFQTPLTVQKTIDNIVTKKYFLPAIQREFVWDTGQIENLFDSLLSGYPIGSFLFWQVSEDSRKRYEFYEFIQNYHELSFHHNPKANTSGQQDVVAILDGQQRLTALLIGLRGTYSSKVKWKKKTTLRAFPERRLYLNLAGPAGEFGENFEFQFLTKEEGADLDEAHAWFRVGTILDLEGPQAVWAYLVDHGLSGNKFAGDCLFRLQEAICKNGLINYYLEEDQDFDKVLNIFIRVNSGGTTLSYSDLLLSVATAKWSDYDAKEEITSFVDELSEIGEGFRVTKDLVLKACLVLCDDIGDVRFKVDNFDEKNVKTIEAQWPSIRHYLRLATSLVASYGFGAHNLTSVNALIPIAYYLGKRGVQENYILSATHSEDRTKVRRWLTAALLSGTFGYAGDTILSLLRTVIGAQVKGPNDSFPAEQINQRLASANRPIDLTEEQVSGLLDYKFGTPQAFLVLSLLYPWLDYSNKFHEDHIVPRSWFTRSRLHKAALLGPSLDEALDRRDRLPNLQLLQGTPNMEKSNKPFDQWLSEVCKTADERSTFKKNHFIPEETATLESFLAFYDKRRTAMVDRLCEVLGIPSIKESVQC